MGLILRWGWRASPAVWRALVVVLQVYLRLRAEIRTPSNAARMPLYLLPALAEGGGLIVPVYACGAWRRIGRWLLRQASSSSPPAVQINLLPFVLVVVVVCACLWPDRPIEGVMFAALSGSTVWEVRTAGSDTNGGGYVSGGTDWSQQDTPQYSVTDGVTAGTTSIVSATAAFGTDVVGNIMYVQGGTGAVVAGWYQIISRTNATTVVVDRSTGLTAGTGVTLKIGGALVSPGQASVLAVASNAIWIKAGTYAITATTAVAGGILTPLNLITIEGYNTVRGDLGTKPLLQASGISGATLLAVSTNDVTVRNVDLDGATLSTMRGVNVTGSRSRLQRIIVRNCPSGGITQASGIAIECYVTGCATSAFVSGGANEYHACVAYDNTVTGFSLIASCIATNCIADSNSGASSDGFFAGNNVSGPFINCTAYNNGRDGFRTASVQNSFINCIAESNAGRGFNNSGSNTGMVMLNCATYNNTSGGTGGTFSISSGNVTGTGSFFVDAPNQNFALNNTSGAGAAARAAGFPGALTVGGTGYLDIGALQHQDSGGGGTIHVGIIGR